MTVALPPSISPRPGFRCCRSDPRCRTCPLRFVTELRDAEASANGITRKDLPPHLADVPACLHKYEPLLRKELTT